jgi:hypothetical protein
MNINLHFDNSITQSIIIVDGQELYYTLGTDGFLNNVITLFRSQDKKRILEIAARIFPQRIKINFSEFEVIDLKFVDRLGLHLTCQRGSNVYDIYEHKGGKYSFYRNDHQVAGMTVFLEKDMTLMGHDLSERLAKYRKDKYTIITDDDCDEELMIAFSLVVRARGGNDTISEAWEKKRFDESWKPKI